MWLIGTSDPVLSVGGEVHRYHRFIQWLQVFVHLCSYFVGIESCNLLKFWSGMWKHSLFQFLILKKIELGSIWNFPYIVPMLPKIKMILAWSDWGKAKVRTVDKIQFYAQYPLLRQTGQEFQEESSAINVGLHGLVYNISVLINIWHHSKMRTYCIQIKSWDFSIS